MKVKRNELFPEIKVFFLLSELNIYRTNSLSNINDRTINESHHGPSTIAANGGHPLTINRSLM